MAVKVLAVVIGFILLFGMLSFRPTESEVYNDICKKYFTVHNSKVLNDVRLLYNIVKKNNFNIDSAKASLSKARVDYKSIEGFVSYYMPGDARILNKAIILEMEEDDEKGNMVIPHGFQYIESMLYSDSVKFFQKKIRDEVDYIFGIIEKLNELVTYMEFNERDVFESMQMQLVRQFILGFANFETGDSRTGVPESAASLMAIQEFLRTAYTDPKQKNQETFNELYKAINKASANLGLVRLGAEPDYFKFYSVYYIPVSESLCKLRALSVSDNSYNTSAINYQIRSVFDPQAFNSYYFLQGKKLASHEAVIELGRTLFFDPALSANNLRACASCHQAGKAFTDGLSLSEAFEPGKKLTRNAPTVINSVLQRKLFHDGRVFTFEDQAGQVMSNPLEMHNDFSQVAEKLRQSPEYVHWFRSAFSGSEDTIISSRSILTAIAEYERSLIGMNSRFDKSISGRGELLNDDEKEGFNLYMGKGNCASCHFIPLFNGVMPIEYVETEWEIIGVPSAEKSAKRKLDPDIGRAGVIDVDIFRHAFKTPTLRNVELTGPYMHNGVFKTLEEVIEFYNTGGGEGLGYEVPLQTLSTDSLHFSSTEKFQIIAFLKSLTDTVNLTSLPTRLPEFPDNEKLNNRPIGGDY